MQSVNPVLLRLLVDVCEVARARIGTMALIVAEPFTCTLSSAVQESALIIPLLKDVAQAKMFGQFVRETFGESSVQYMLAAQSAVLRYDPDMDLALDFDDAYEAGWQMAHARLQQEAHAANVKAFVEAMQQRQVAPGMPVEVQMPAGKFAGTVVYVHPMWHAVAVELADGKTYPRVVMLGAHHDLYPIEHQTNATC